jgi:hypothetical protein
MVQFSVKTFFFLKFARVWIGIGLDQIFFERATRRYARVYVDSVDIVDIGARIERKTDTQYWKPYFARARYKQSVEPCVDDRRCRRSPVSMKFCRWRQCRRQTIDTDSIIALIDILLQEDEENE